MEKNVIDPVRALEIASKIGNAAATRNLKEALAASPELIKFAAAECGKTVIQKVKVYF